MYKKVYVEITNNCNLSCNFCIKNKRNIKYMTLSDFKKILTKLNGYTKYLYLHVLGEPLMHPKINEFINEASKNFYVNITTNGYLIKNIADNKNIRQLNISLHSFDTKYKISLEDYMDNIFYVVDKLKNNTYISFRLWVKNKYSNEIIKLINKRYNSNIKKVDNIKISKNIYLNIHDEFIWPDLENNIHNNNGKCYALKDHIGILVDGTIVPCCLDSLGTIKLGNIFEENLENVINSKRYLEMLEGFKNNKKTEELCKKCNFIK